MTSNTDLQLLRTLVNNFENGVYSITPIEAWWLGLGTRWRPEMRNRDTNPQELLAYRESEATRTFTDYREFSRIVPEHLQNGGGIWKIFTLLEWSELVKQKRGYLIHPTIIKAWTQNNLYSEWSVFFIGLDCKLLTSPKQIEEGSVILSDMKEDDIPTTIEEVTQFTTTDIIKELYIELSIEEWRNFFKKVAIRHNRKNKTFALSSLGYEVWLKWDEDNLEMVNPSCKPRDAYFISNINNLSETPTPEKASGSLIDAYNCWGNTLISLMKTGMTRDSFGRLLRVKATNLVAALQCYGNKSSYNEAIEYSKYGIINLTTNLGVQIENFNGVNLEFTNNSDQYATSALYNYLNKLMIVSFPQHQGEDIRAGFVAQASGITQLTYKGIYMFIFERAVDKVEKLFNRCALLNRVGVTGYAEVTEADLNDM